MYLVLVPVSMQAGFFFPAFIANPWLITMGILIPDGQPSFAEPLLLHEMLQIRQTGCSKVSTKTDGRTHLLRRNTGRGGTWEKYSGNSCNWPLPDA